MINLILLTLVLLNNTTYPGETVEIYVQGEGTLKLSDNCTYFCNFNKNCINATSGNYTICVSYSCKEGNYTIIADNTSYNFTVLKPTYDYLLNSTIKLEIERNKLKKENENLMTKLNEYINLTAMLEKEKSNLEKTINELKDRISYLENRVSELELDKNSLESALNSLQKLYYYSKLALIFILAFVVGAYVAIIRR